MFCGDEQVLGNMVLSGFPMAVHQRLAESLTAHRGSQRKRMTRMTQEGKNLSSMQILMAWQPIWASAPSAHCCAEPSERKSR